MKIDKKFYAWPFPPCLKPPQLPEDEEKAECFNVPWGYYAAFNDHKSVPKRIGTESLASCFAYIINYDNGKGVFLAHVSSDAETIHILKNSRTKKEERSKLKGIMVLGAEPNDKTTLRRITAIIAVTEVPHAIVQAKTGSVVYEPSSDQIYALPGKTNIKNDEQCKIWLKDNHRTILKKRMDDTNGLAKVAVEDCLDLEDM